MDSMHMNRRHFLASTGIALACTGAGATAPSQESGKRVIFTTQFAANYCTHLYAAAGINWRSAFPARPCLSQEHRELLVRHREFLAFGQGRSGPFASFMYFLPAYLDVEDFDSYFAALTGALEQNKFTGFASSHRMNMDDLYISNQYDYFRHLSGAEWEAVIEPLLPVFKQIGAVFVSNQDCYRSIWEKEVEPVLADKAGQLNGFMRDHQYIPAWEELTGRTFTADNYSIILCHENTNGPDANSVAYDRNIFYYDADLLRFRDFVSHEIGTHLLLDLFDGDGDRDLRYAAVECLAYFLNRIILDTGDLHYTLHGLQPDRFIPLYEKLYKPEKPYEQLVNEVLTAG